jgi:hypothetical protein
MKLFLLLLAGVAANCAAAGPPTQNPPALRDALQRTGAPAGAPRQLTEAERAELRRQLASARRPQPRRP